MHNTIYIIRNSVDHRVYVGQTWKPLKKRWKNGQGYSGSIHIHNAIQKYGKDKFYYEELVSCKTQEDADYLERHFIELYKATDPEYGFNITNGGQIAFFTGKKHTEVAKRKMSETHKGINTWMKGRTNHHSDERKAELSQQFKEMKIWEKAPDNSHLLVQWVDEHHTKIRKHQYPGIVERYNGGESARQLAEAHNVHISVISKIVKGSDGVGNYRSKKIKRSEWALITERYDGGTKVSELAKQYGVYDSTIRRIIHKFRKLGKQ